jgi:hypothetical protein
VLLAHSHSRGDLGVLGALSWQGAVGWWELYIRPVERRAPRIRNGPGDVYEKPPSRRLQFGRVPAIDRATVHSFRLVRRSSLQRSSATSCAIDVSTRIASTTAPSVGGEEAGAASRWSRHLGRHSIHRLLPCVASPPVVFCPRIVATRMTSLPKISQVNGIYSSSEFRVQYYIVLVSPHQRQDYPSPSPVKLA